MPARLLKMVPEESRQLFKLLGTPAVNKKHVEAPGGHFMPHNVLVRETLDWLDTHFGEVGS